MAAPSGGIQRAQLRASLVSVGGDGAEVAGGPAALHSSTRAGEQLYADVFPEARTALVFWDLFHRDAVGGRRAMQATPYLMEIFDVSSIMEQLFGIGQGRVLFRGVAQFMGETPIAPTSAAASTRPSVHGYRVCASLVRNFRTYH